MGRRTAGEHATSGPGSADPWAIALRELADAAEPFLPLGALAPGDYAAKHALFEACSDQRHRMTDWLVDCVRALPRPTPSGQARTPLRVLSIGCGDGSVDVEIARVLAAAGPLTYVGVEPHEPSAARFLERLGALDGVDVRAEPVSFDRMRAGTEFDLVIAVHSLYYVRDLRAALVAAVGMLTPGGCLVVLHAPRELLNSFVGVLAPGPAQDFSDALARELGSMDVTVRCERIDATLDLRRREAIDEAQWRGVLDFTVQAEIPDGLIAAVLLALSQAALERGARGLVVSHPVDAFVIAAAG